MPWGAESPTLIGTGTGDLSVDLNDVDEVVASWRSGNDLYAARLIDGQWGEAELIESASGSASGAVVISNDEDGTEDGELLAVFLQNDGTANSVMTNRCAQADSPVTDLARSRRMTRFGGLITADGKIRVQRYNNWWRSHSRDRRHAVNPTELALDTNSARPSQLALRRRPLFGALRCRLLTGPQRIEHAAAAPTPQVIVNDDADGTKMVTLSARAERQPAQPLRHAQPAQTAPASRFTPCSRGHWASIATAPTAALPQGPNCKRR
jgi:hypothetical protein